MPKNLTLFALEIRVYRWQRNFYRRRKTMHNQEETAGKDIFLLLFVSIVLWLLVFQSGIFQ